MEEVKAGKKIFPDWDEVFTAFKLTPFDKVRVVILGADPYHGAGQAHGLAFSVKHGVKIPPSLQNIFKELSEDLGVETPSHGCLEEWAQQGVLLLNTTLTVEEGKANSHFGQGWERLTDRVIEAVSSKDEPVVFILWGKNAQAKIPFLDRKKHLVLERAHPSPLSAYRGFFGSKCFSKANQFLESKGVAPIVWSLR